jgi:hypothetical protein
MDVFDTLVAERPADTTGNGPVELTELLRVLVGSAGHAMATAALIDPTDMAADDLQQVTLGIEALRRALDATQTHLLAELTDRDCCDHTHGSSTSRWLAHAAQLPAGIARQRVTLATALRHQLPEQVDRALTDGTIGIDHARVIADATNPRNTAALAAEIDHHLTSAAHSTGFHAWRRTYQARAALLDDDGTYDPATDLARNRLHLSPTTQFMELRGELVGDHALIVRDTIEALADELFAEFTRDHTHNPDIEVPNRATLRALALEEACRRALARDPDDTRPARTQAHLVLHGRALTDGRIALDPIAHDRDGCPWLLRDTAVLLCDTSVAATVLDHLGLPTDTGHNSRVPGPRLRRALDARDGGCTHPGCDRPPRHCDAHHIHPWQHGGRTTLSNLVLLCTRHHRVAHRHRWRLTLTHDGWTHWTTPTGHTYWGQRHHHTQTHQRAGPAPPT